MDIKDNTMNEYVVNWTLNEICNFNCAYCFNKKKDLKSKFKFSEKILSKKIYKNILNLKETAKVLLIGGEPFLHEDIIKICKVLTKKFHVTIATNLSIEKKIQEFVNCIDPASIDRLNISCHIEEREKRKEVYDLIRNIDLLRKKGFNFILNYVLYPSLMNRFIDDYAFFNSYGIKIQPKFVRGNFDDKFYPYAYDHEIKNKFLIIEKNEFSNSMPINARGLQCHINSNKIKIDNGVIRKCSYDKFQNNFSNAHNKFKFDSDPVICKNKLCNCTARFKFADFKEVHYYLYEGLFLYVYGDLKGSKEYFCKVLTCDNKFSPAYNNLGVIEYDLGNFKEANKFFYDAMSIHQNNSLYVKNYVLSLLKLEETEKAKNFCVEFLKSRKNERIFDLSEKISRKENFDLRPEISIEFNPE